MGRFDAAADCCRAAIQCMPERAGPRGVLAQALASAGRLEEAAEAAAAALERAPRDRLLLHLAASIALQRSLPRAAVAFARRALAMDPHDQRALADIAFATGLPVDGAHAGRDGSQGEVSSAASLLDLDRLVRTTVIDAPHGHPLHSFNQRVAADLCAITDSTGAAAMTLQAGRTPLVGGRRVNGLFDLELPWVAILREALNCAVDDYVAALGVAASHPVMTGRPARREFVAWANLMTCGDHERAHIHEAGWLSGVYYAHTPGAGGALLLGGHCSVAERGRTLRRIDPRAGLVVLFPSYLCHRTEPFRGPGRRISIAFDVPRFWRGER